MKGSEQPTGALSRGGLQDSAVRGAVWTVVHTFIAIPVAFLVNLLMARVLGAADYGRLAFLTALMEVVARVLTAGFGSAVVQFGAKAHAAGRTDAVSRLLSQSQGFRLLVVAPVLSVVVLLFADVPVGALVIAVVFGIVFPAALDGAVACLAIENKTADGAKIALVTSLATQAAVVAVVLLARTPDAVWTTRLIVTGVAVALCLIPISASYRRAVLRPALPRGMPTGFWRYALPVGVAGVIGGLVMSRSEIFLMNWLTTPAAVGVFALAFGLAGHVFAPAQAFVGPLVPAISGLLEVDAPAVRPAFRRVMRSGATVVGVVEAVAVVPLAVLVPVLYGQEFAEAGPVVVALGVAAGFVTVGGPVVAFVSARLSAGEMLKATSVALVVDVVLAVALIPPLGIWGAVIANIGGSMTSLLLLARSELRGLDITVRLALRDALPCFVGAALAGLLLLATDVLQGNPWLEAVGAAVAGGVLYVVVLRVTRSGLTPADSDAVTRGIPAPARRLGAPLLGLLTAGLEDRSPL
ncbi:lipopolysaccharide biosynthesis protein [Terrabacter sp. 2RAF25]|uniref:lipopolysaccharide biosynthesis protein n=1 Tax=Terrabacter sp. 2RAF25 TaxID=3232998 RepID=UPI003F9E4419